MLEQRDYQDRIHDKALDYLRTHDDKKKSGDLREDVRSTVLIESPTGSGKTVMAMKLAQEISAGALDRNFNVVWMAHRTELRRQAEKTNRDLFGIKNFNTISMFDNNPQRFRGGNTILFIDECQHSPANSALSVVTGVDPQIIVGLTATPYRTDRAKLLFEKVIRDAGIHQLIREGYLAEFNQWITKKEWTPEHVADLYMNHKDRWGLSVSYFLRVNDATRMAEILKANGIAAEAITGSSPREDILDAFDKGEIEHLSNCEVLTEGFDAPKLKTVFIRPGSKGPTVQMAGRVLRKHEDTPITNIVQNQYTKYPFNKHAPAKSQWAEVEHGEWRSIDAKNVEPLVKKIRLLKSQARVKLPSMLQKDSSKTGKIAELWSKDATKQ